VVFELGFACQSHADYEALLERLLAFDSLPTSDADFRRGLEVQAALAIRSQHRAISLVDALVAAVAEAHQLAVLHYDGDFELIAEVTGQPHKWVVDRGTAD
jgi:predicted nucleic acid-binding protein